MICIVDEEAFKYEKSCCWVAVGEILKRVRDGKLIVVIVWLIENMMKSLLLL